MGRGFGLAPHLKGIMPLKEARPFGSIAECEEIGLSPREYATCSEPSRDNIGCGMWDLCPIRNGPKNYGVRFIKKTSNGTRTRRSMVPCYGVVQLRDAYETGGFGVVQLMAEEGQPFTINGSRKLPPDPAKPGLDPGWESTQIPVTIEKHKRFNDMFRTSIELKGLQEDLRGDKRGRFMESLVGGTVQPRPFMFVKDGDEVTKPTGSVEVSKRVEPVAEGPRAGTDDRRATK